MYTESVIYVTASHLLNVILLPMTAPLRMGPVRHYRDLVVWQQSLKMVSEVYRATASSIRRTLWSDRPNSASGSIGPQ